MTGGAGNSQPADQCLSRAIKDGVDAQERYNFTEAQRKDVFDTHILANWNACRALEAKGIFLRSNQ